MKKVVWPVIGLFVLAGAWLGIAHSPMGSRMLFDEVCKDKPSVVWAEFLVVSGADVFARTDSGLYLLDEACLTDNEAVRMLLEHVDRLPYDSKALQKACVFNHVYIARRLLELGADPNVKTENMFGPSSSLLESACYRDDAYLADALLDHGADANEKDSYGEAHLENAVRLGRCDLAETLLRHGANPNGRIHQDDPYLNIACLGGYSEERECDKERLVAVLLNAGCNPNMADSHQLTALHMLNFKNAARADRVVGALLAHGADTNARDKYGDTPLICAINGDKDAVAMALIMHGADPNAANNALERFPLYCAIRKGKADLVKALIDHGADVNALVEGKTLLRYFSSREVDTEIIQVLQKAGAHM